MPDSNDQPRDASTPPDHDSGVDRTDSSPHHAEAATGADEDAPPEALRTETPSLAQRLGTTGALGVAWMLLPALGGFYLLARLGSASEWLTEHGVGGISVYVGIFIITAGFGLLPTYAQAVLGGWVFGIARGLPAALAGFTGAALVGYAVTRLVTRDQAERAIAENERASAVRDALIGRGFWRTLGIVTLVRVPPNSPFALTNLVMASAGVRFVPFVLGTMIGMLPRTAVVVAVAAAGADSGARDIQSFVKERGALPMIIGLVLMVTVLAIIGSIANRAINRVVGAPAQEERGGDG